MKHPGPRPSLRFALALSTLLLGLPLQAGETMLLAGVGFGPFRNPPRQAYASLEVDHVFTTYPAGCWVSADLAPEGRFLGAGLLLTLPMGEHWRVLAGSERNRPKHQSA